MTSSLPPVLPGSPRNNVLSSESDHDILGGCVLCERSGVHVRRYSCSYTSHSASLCRGCFALIAPHKWGLRETIELVRSSIFAISRAPSAKAAAGVAADPAKAPSVKPQVASTL